jgi:hydrophobic/amphiphilic exporter-1 (mainly G- bacteria), HAE1 family
MNWNFSAWSIRNPVGPVLLFAVLLLLGFQSFSRLPITQFPNIDVPVISVSVSQSGAAPAELESQITKRIEDSVSSITGVKNITSTMSDGSSVTAIEFRLEVPTSQALEDVKDAVAKIRSDLPGGIDEPIVQKVDVEGGSIQTYAVKAPGLTLEQLSWYVDDVVKRQVQGLLGVGRVDRYGGVVREIRVDLDPGKLQSLGVTAAYINSQLSAINADSGAGKSEVGGTEQAIRTLGGARDLETLKDITLPLPGGNQIKLRDLASVTDGTEEPKSFARFNGDPVVTFSIFRAKGSSSVDVGNRVSAKVEELDKANDAVTFALVDDTVFSIYGNYIAAMEGLIEGAILAIIVVLIFLRDWRATLISAVSLPLSAIPTFWAMEMLGFSLNLVSFLGITLATGILVDDAIVEIENIARHMRMGKSAYRAAMDAADEIGLAVIAITFTIVAVFVPVSFMGGIVGQYFKQFGMTVAVAVLFSLLVARLITPMLAAYFMRAHGHEEERTGPILRAYIRVLRFLNWGPTLTHEKMKLVPEGHVWQPRVMSYATILLSFGILFASTLLIPLLPTGFIPRGDESRFIIGVELPPGSRLEETLKVTEGMAQTIRKNSDVSHVFVLGGASPTGSQESRYASIFVNLNKRDHNLFKGIGNAFIGGINGVLRTSIPKIKTDGRETPQWDVENAVLPQLASLPDVRWYKVTERGTREIEFNMLSNDPEALAKSLGDLEAALRKETILRSVMGIGALERPEVKIVPRTEEAAKLGITAAQISQAVRVAMIGDFDPLLAKFNSGDRLLPIRVQTPESARTNFSDITNLRLTASTGQNVPLSSVADVTFSQGPSSIKRLNRQRQATIGADIVPGNELGTATQTINDVAKKLNFPANVKIQEGGDAEVQNDINTEFVKAASLGIVLMMGVLVLLLGNVFQPFAILLSLPLSIGGVVIALLVFDRAFSMPVIIGMLMLIGIVAKNGIMLVDFAVERVRHGMSRLDAIVDSGHKRARPIVMTTLAMGAGMLPSAMGIGEGGEFRSPMAIAVIGGLIAATFLSLLFVPSFFIVMDDLARLTSWAFSRFVGASDEPAVQDIESLAKQQSRTEQVLEQLADKIESVEDRLADGRGRMKAAE